MQVNSKALDNCESPKFVTCDFVKVHCKPNKIKAIHNNPMKEQDLNKGYLLPV